MNNFFSISSLNTGSLVSAARRVFLSELVKNGNSGIWLIQESHLNSDINFSIANYNIFRADRQTGGGGGVALIIHENIPIGECKKFSEGVEAISVKTFLNDCWIQIVSCYIPPGVTPSSVITNKFSSFINGNVCIIGGDFNARDLSFNDCFGNANGRWLIGFCGEENLNIINPTNPTCWRSKFGSYIDKFLVKGIEIGAYCMTFNSFSDHMGIKTVSGFYSNNAGHNLNMMNIFSWAKVSKLNKYILNKISKLNIPIHTNLNRDCLNNMVGRFNDIFTSAIDLFVPSAQVSFQNITLSSNTLAIKRKFRFLCRKLRRVRFLSDDIIKNIKVELKLVKLMLLNSIKYDISSYYTNLLINLSDAHSFYHTVGARRKSAKFVRIGAIYDENGVLYEGDSSLSQVFVNNFYKNHNLTVNETSNVSDSIESAFSNWRERIYIRFSTECSALPKDNTVYPQELTCVSEVLSIIASRNNKLSSGIDNMPNRIIKLLDYKILAILTTLFNQLISAGYFPDCWKKAIVIPIPKTGKDSSLVTNWRPISLLPSIAKIFERLLAIRIRKFVTEAKIIPPHQFGFMTSHSTCHPLAILQNTINKNFNEGKITSVIFLDVQAAFDTVWHNGLIYKLSKLGFPPYLVSVVMNFLKNRSFRVKVGNVYSEYKSIPAGVPQGSVLGPLLFIIYCQDIPVSNDYQLLQFADDTSITFSYSTFRGIEYKINSRLDVIVKWFSKWKFRLNINKTELLHVVGNCKQISSYRRTLAKLQVKIDDKVIVPSRNVKYLGLVFTRTNRFNAHIDKALNNLTKAKNGLSSLLYSKFIDAKFKRLLYSVYLRPVLTYASQVWITPSNLSSYQMERLRLAERKLLRCTHNIFRARNNFKFASNNFLYNEYSYDRIDVYMCKLSVRFHESNMYSVNPLIVDITKEYVIGDNASNVLKRTDFVYNLHI